MSQFFTSGSQSIGASASPSVLPMNIQDWFPLGLTGLISLQSKGIYKLINYKKKKKEDGGPNDLHIKFSWSWSSPDIAWPSLFLMPFLLLAVLGRNGAKLRRRHHLWSEVSLCDALSGPRQAAHHNLSDHPMPGTRHHLHVSDRHPPRYSLSWTPQDF